MNNLTKNIMLLPLLAIVSFYGSVAIANPSQSSPQIIASAMANEIVKSQNLQTWINSGTNSTKLFRRLHFGKDGNKQFPSVIASGNSLVVYDRGPKKTPSILQIDWVNGSHKVSWNTIDVTRLNNETLEAWYKRMQKSLLRNDATKNKNFKSAGYRPLKWLFPSASAQQVDKTGQRLAESTITYFRDFGLSYWTAVIASMPNDKAWRDQQIETGSSGVGGYSDDGDKLLRMGASMKQQHNLTCDGDTAYFDLTMDDWGFASLRIKTSYDRSAALARVTFIRDKKESEPNFQPKMGELGRMAYPVKMNSPTSIFYLYNAHTGKNTNYSSTPDSKNAFGRELYLILNQIADPDLQMANASPDGLAYTLGQAEVLEALSDFARACCSNTECRGKSELPAGTGTRTSQ